MSNEAPQWLMHTFVIVNATIAGCYGLLALYFVKRIKLPGKKDRNPLTILACIGAGLFFVGCAHTHLDLTVWAMERELKPHWYSWWNVLSHFLQAVGGITFWVLATYYLQLNIFDKKHYEKTQKEVLNGHDDSGSR